MNDQLLKALIDEMLETRAVIADGFRRVSSEVGTLALMVDSEAFTQEMAAAVVELRALNGKLAQLLETR